MKKDSAKDIKIAFFDVDGTLVDMEKKVITPAMIETLKHLKENGIILCMATGRGPYPVSYTHLDVYKRQEVHTEGWNNSVFSRRM